MNENISVTVHEGQGPPVLLVHGMLASRAQWLLNLEALAKVSTPITVELWGHHDSPSPEDAALYAPNHYAEIFDQIRQRLGVERWFVGGCSLGAALTIRYALAYPEHVIGQFFTNSSSAFADEETSRTWQANSDASYERVMAGGLAGLERIPVHPCNARRLPEGIRQALVVHAKSHSLLGIAGTMRWTSPYASIRANMADLKTPSLLVCGTKERRFRPLRDAVEASMPALRICDLVAGHGVNMAAADGFNAAVTAFIGELVEESSHGG